MDNKNEDQEILKNYQRQLKLAGWNGSDAALVVSGKDQTIHLLKEGILQRDWPISTALAGFGNHNGSGKTPIGLHKIALCVGHGQPVGTVFKGRVPTGEVVEDSYTDEDLITTRILWLEGLQPGFNKGGSVDTRLRYIYIHGTPRSDWLGHPVSAGCVRMHNQHILELFEQVDCETLVLIV